MIIDTHCHISDRWYEPGETLLFQMDRCEVERAWLVQLLNVYDNQYQQAWRARHPDRLISIVGIDWTQPDAVDRLLDLAAVGAAGVRLRPGSRSPGADPLAIWHAAAAAGLIVSCVGSAAQFCEPQFAALVGEIRGLRVVLEHLGGLARPDVGDLEAATPRIASLARLPQLSLKVPGLGQLISRSALSSQQTPTEQPTIAAMLDSFGPARLMWASDFPVISTREGYGNALQWARAAVPTADRSLIFGIAAQRLIDDA